MLKATNDPELRKEVDRLLESEFKITHDGAVSDFIGLQIEWKIDPDGTRYLSVHQHKYIEKILKRYGMADCNPVTSPCNTTGKPHEVYMFPNPVPAENNDPALVSEYRGIVGALIYPSILSRLDISYAVSAIGQFMSNPTLQHLTAAYRILRP